MYNYCPHRKGFSPMKRNYVNTFLLVWGIYFIVTLPYPIAAIAPKYETAYACEGKTLTIECEAGDLINLIRANYGRFSITICNDHGNVDWSVNCMSAKSLRVLHSKCAHKQNCSVLASTNMFGDPCPGTHKYLEAHYQCVSAAQTSTTTNRPSPPWLITSQPSVWSTSTVRLPSTTRINLHDSSISDSSSGGSSGSIALSKSSVDKNHQSTLSSKNVVGIKFKPTSSVSPATLATTDPSSPQQPVTVLLGGNQTNSNRQNSFGIITTEGPIASIASGGSDSGGIEQNNSDALAPKNPSQSAESPISNIVYSTQASVLLNNKFDNYFCGPRTSRNLFWNLTRVGEVNVQPCPGGATGIAKWRCVYANKQQNKFHNIASTTSDIENQATNHMVQVVWQPATPDLTHCRSLWLNSLEVRVNQRDSSLISIANDLSQVTSSKTLYGGDMLVTTKIIQIMSEKMTYDIETFPDQRQRETIVSELLQGVVKTGSNLLDATQHLSWLDLSFEDQMRVATSLLTGLEDNAFLLADTINRERNFPIKVKNILLSVRVLETRNIIGNEIFPEGLDEQWHVSDDCIELPRGALIENSEGGLVRIVFVAFDRLESILKPADSWIELKYSINSGAALSNNHSSQNFRNRVLNSKVISASLGKGRHIQLSQPIRLILKHLKTENVSNPMCVFWNYIDHAWSEDGCFVESTNKTHTICMCNHLTNFAILMEIIDESNNSLLSIFDDNMHILIYISIAICVLFIIVALLTLKLFNGIFVKSSRTTIYKNLYICLLVIEILFLFGIEQSETSIWCGFTTAFLHCAFLCVIAWIFFEGFQLYITLTTEEILLEVEKSSKIIWYYLMTYGLSFTIVAISLAIDPAAYTQADYCVWMESNYLFYFTFVSPIFIYVLATIVYSALSTITMCKQYKTSLKNKEHTRLASVRFYLRCSFIFLLIIVACWIFGYLYMVNIKLDSPSAHIYGYFFVVLNALQGIFVFGFHCINNEKIRREYRKYMRHQSWLPKCLRCSKSTSITSSSPNNQHQIRNSGNTASNNALAIPIGQTIGCGIGGSSGGVGGQAGTLTRHHHHSGTITGGKGTHRHNIIVERIGGIGAVGGGSSGTNTLRGGVGIGGQTSPTSSAGSTHLIYNAATQPDIQQDWSYPHSTNFNMVPSQLHHPQLPSQLQHLPTELVNKNLNNLDDKFLYYDRKLKKIKQQPSLSSSASSSPRQHQHQQNQQHQQHFQQQQEYFYWTEKSNKRKNNGDLGTSKSDPMHVVYPSYKKKIMHYAQSPSHPEIGGGGDVQTLNDCDFDSGSLDDEHQQCYLRYNQRQHHMVPAPSEDELSDSHLIHSGGQPQPQQQHYHQTSGRFPYHYRHGQDFEKPVLTNNQLRLGYYNQHQSPGTYVEEPVYEEIISNRASGGADGGTDILGGIGGDEDEDLMDGDGYRIRDIVQKDDFVLRQSSSRPLMKSSYNFTQMAIKPTAMNGDGASQLQQKQIGRNLSAILDENNTVICYLEPMSK